jgi:hypothetical protein
MDVVDVRKTGNNMQIGYVCLCGHYAIEHLKRRIKTQYKRTVVEHPMQTLDSADPLHKKIWDRIEAFKKMRQA